MIPKIIHYCWLSSDPYPELVERCLSSWKSHLIDYEFYRWDIERAPKVPWVIEAYNEKKYAFAADYIRFYALYWHGGIYLDIDVEVIKSFDSMLAETSFIGFDINGYIEGAIIGAIPELPWIKACLDDYQDRHFVRNGGTISAETVPLLIGNVLRAHFGIETGDAEASGRYDGISIFSFHYFSPKSVFSQRYDVSDETICIHHFDGGWVKRTVWLSVKFYIHRMMLVIFGQRGHNAIIRLLRRIIDS